MLPPRLVVPGALLVVAAALGMADAPREKARAPEAEVRRPRPGAAVARESSGFVFRLGEGSEDGAAPALVARPPAEPLAERDARRVLDRLPPLAAEPRVEPFALREASPPPPRTGRSVRASFPPAGDASRPDAAPPGPLEILRRMPEGEVELAPHLSITFSQPMVALETHEALARENVPVRLSPSPAGEWRWVGAKTLVFEPSGRFPMATEYRVEVPAGTRGAGGGALASPAAWSFSTPPLRLLARHPESGPARRDVLLFAAFDQRVDPAAVLASMRLRAGGGEVPVRLGTAAEVEADEAVARLAKGAEPGRWLAFRPERALPPDAAVTVEVSAGAPSAEGPRRTVAAQSWSFRTYGPFRVRRHECGWNGRCTPFDPWRVELTNPVDPKTLRKELVRVEPELPGLKVEGWGDTLAIRGVPRGSTTYRVTLSPEIADAFGQPLEPGPALAFTVGQAPAALVPTRGDFVVLDPAGGPRFPVHSTNHPALRVEAYAVGPEDWVAWQAYRQQGFRNDEKATPPGRRVIDTTVRVAGEPDTLTETLLDLSPAFESGLGQVVLVVRPATATRESRNQAIRAWVQATRIGLDAFSDQETLVAWASDLADGRPLADVELALGSGTRASATARTDATGLARLALGEAPAPLLVARRGRDVAILPSQTGWWAEGAGWRKTPRTDALRFCVFDDRKMYRPGEEVRLKGWLRRIAAGPRGDVEALPSPTGALAWTLRDSQGNEVGKGEARLSGARRLRPRVEAARHHEPGDGRGPARGPGQRARRAAARARLRGAGVPPAGVRGEGRRQRGPVRRRRRRDGDGERRLLRGRGAAGRRGGVAGGGDAGHVPPAEPGRLLLRHVRAVVGLAAGDPGAGARGDDDRPHRRVGRPPPAHRLRPGRPAAAAPRPRGSHRHGREPPGLDGRGGPPRPPLGALRRPARRAGLRAEGRAHRDRRDRHRPRGRGRGRATGAAAGRAARLGAGRGRVEGSPEGRPGARGPVGRGAGARALRGERGRRVACSRPGRRRAGARERDGAAGLGGGRARAATARPRGGEGHARPRPEGVPGGRRGEGARPRALRPRRGGADAAPQRPRARGALHDRRRLAHARDPDRGRLHPQRPRPGGSRGTPVLRQRQPRPAGRPRPRARSPSPSPRARRRSLPAARPCSSWRSRTRPAGPWRRRSSGRGGGRGGPRADRLPAARPARRLLREARGGRGGPAPAVLRPAGATGGARGARAGHRCSPRGRSDGDGGSATRHGRSAGDAQQGDVGGGQGPRAHPRLAPISRRSRCSRASVPTDAEGRARVAGEAARQPHPLPRDGHRRRGRAALRLGRGDARRPPAAHGAAVRRPGSSTSATASSCRSWSRTRPTAR